MDFEGVAVLHFELKPSVMPIKQIYLESKVQSQNSCLKSCLKSCQNCRIETHRIRIICWIDPLPIKQEPHGTRALSLTLTESIHQLLESSGTLDLEEDFIIGISDLDVEVFRLVVCLCAAIW